MVNAGLLPWQVKYLAANVASELQFHSVFEPPEKDRNPGGYALTIHESEGERWLGLISDAKHFHTDRTDFEALGWSADYQNQPTLTVQISDRAVGGVVQYNNTGIRQDVLQKTPKTVEFLLTKGSRLE